MLLKKTILLLGLVLACQSLACVSSESTRVFWNREILSEEIDLSTPDKAVLTYLNKAQSGEFDEIAKVITRTPISSWNQCEDSKAKINNVEKGSELDLLPIEDQPNEAQRRQEITNKRLEGLKRRAIRINASNSSDFELLESRVLGEDAIVTVRQYISSNYKVRHLFKLKKMNDGWKIFDITDANNTLGIDPFAERIRSGCDSPSLQ